MKFKSRSIPNPDKGVSFENEKVQTVPDQALSLKEILERFTRGEPVSVGRSAEYDEEGDEDLEKLQRMDLVDREMFIQSLVKIQNDHVKQEAQKAKVKEAEIRKTIEKEIREKAELEYAKGSGADKRATDGKTDG